MSWQAALSAFFIKLHTPATGLSSTSTQVSLSEARSLYANLANAHLHGPRGFSLQMSSMNVLREVRYKLLQWGTPFMKSILLNDILSNYALAASQCTYHEKALDNSWGHTLLLEQLECLAEAKIQHIPLFTQHYRYVLQSPHLAAINPELPLILLSEMRNNAQQKTQRHDHAQNVNMNANLYSDYIHENAVNNEDGNINENADKLPNVDNITKNSKFTNNDNVDALIDCIVGLAASGETGVAMTLCTSFRWSSLHQKTHKRSARTTTTTTTTAPAAAITLQTNSEEDHARSNSEHNKNETSEASDDEESVVSLASVFPLIIRRVASVHHDGWRQAWALASQLNYTQVLDVQNPGWRLGLIEAARLWHHHTLLQNKKNNLSVYSHEETSENTSLSDSSTSTQLHGCTPFEWFAEFMIKVENLTTPSTNDKNVKEQSNEQNTMQNIPVEFMEAYVILCPATQWRQVLDKVLKYNKRSEKTESATLQLADNVTTITIRTKTNDEENTSKVAMGKVFAMLHRVHEPMEILELFYGKENVLRMMSRKDITQYCQWWETSSKGLLSLSSSSSPLQSSAKEVEEMQLLLVRPTGEILSSMDKTHYSIYHYVMEAWAAIGQWQVAMNFYDALHVLPEYAKMINVFTDYHAAHMILSNTYRYNTAVKDHTPQHHGRKEKEEWKHNTYCPLNSMTYTFAKRVLRSLTRKRKNAQFTYRESTLSHQSHDYVLEKEQEQQQQQELQTKTSHVARLAVDNDKLIELFAVWAIIMEDYEEAVQYAFVYSNKSRMRAGNVATINTPHGPILPLNSSYQLPLHVEQPFTKTNYRYLTIIAIVAEVHNEDDNAIARLLKDLCYSTTCSLRQLCLTLSIIANSPTAMQSCGAVCSDNAETPNVDARHGDNISEDKRSNITDNVNNDKVDKKGKYSFTRTDQLSMELLQLVVSVLRGMIGTTQLAFDEFVKVFIDYNLLIRQKQEYPFTLASMDDENDDDNDKNKTLSEIKLVLHEQKLFYLIVELLRGTRPNDSGWWKVMLQVMKEVIATTTITTTSTTDGNGVTNNVKSNEVLSMRQAAPMLISAGVSADIALHFLPE